MPRGTLISAEELASLIAQNTPPVVLDCQFELGQPEAGPAAYRARHIPGARHAHLDHDLAGQPDGTNGRHPLPDRATLARWLAAQGVSGAMQVVCYDASGGAWAARAWWLLKWLGHHGVAVLDGGLQAWVAAGGALETGDAAPATQGSFVAGPPLVAEPVDAHAVLANVGRGEWQVLDARDPARFAGEPNPIDPVPGHIPGARNRFFRDNLGPDGLFRSPEELAEAFAALDGGKPVVLSCGSGVTACHNALAMAVAGVEPPRLYPGSWSEWISDPARPVARGPADG